MHKFFQVTLRTTDVEAARHFYRAVLNGQIDHVFQLHEQALARGARPHWLGFLEVPDVAAAVAAFVARGAQTLGPPWVDSDGLEAAPLRDPGGAVLALAKPQAASVASAPSVAPCPEVVWFSLNTHDVERARIHYTELFGWQFEAPVDRGELGTFHPFRWDESGSGVGSMSDVLGREGVHPHWLFQFRVAALDPALSAVRAGGGQVIGPLTLPGGERLAICDDAQGAAFALRECP